MQLCLGTVQFGMDYGVFEQKKKDVEYCVRCLDYATQNGISAIDTATAYGTAEAVVGEFLKKKTISREKLWVSTKLLPNCLDDVASCDYSREIRERIKTSLKTLGTDYVDAYFLHSSRYVENDAILEAFQTVKEEGLANKVGVSIYYENEARLCMNNPYVQYVQTPYSIFDHRMKEVGLFDIDNRGKLEVDSRTTFIKGLIRLKEDEIPGHLSKAKPILSELDKVCSETGYSRIELAIGYVKREKGINHLVFGIRDIEQLKEDIAAFDKEIPNEVLDDMDVRFNNIDTDLVVPSLWKK